MSIAEEWGMQETKVLVPGERWSLKVEKRAGPEREWGIPRREKDKEKENKKRE